MQVSATIQRIALGTLAAVAALWMMLAPQAFAQEEDERVGQDAATAHVQTLAGSALEILRQEELSLEEREAIFRELLREGFNLEAIGNLVLARNRLDASPTELEEYHRLFSEFVLARYAMLMGGYAGENFAILSATDSGRRDVLIMSRISRPGGDPLSAAWRVRAYDGAPKIIDVQVENISMVISQRDEFNAVIQRGGFEALLESLRAQTEMLPAEAPS
ncbi:ABC transporter substrate-binding protein [bacterium AH-315-P15]|nr:ABC transporter substrate-binding protein [bacterium AH-315-P15]